MAMKDGNFNMAHRKLLDIYLEAYNLVIQRAMCLIFMYFRGLAKRCSNNSPDGGGDGKRDLSSGWRVTSEVFLGE